MIIKTFLGPDFKLVVHDKGFEFFPPKANPSFVGEIDYSSVFEFWEEELPTCEWLDNFERRAFENDWQQAMSIDKGEKQ